MPLDGSMGFSDDTVVKQRDLGYVLSVLLRVAQSCMQRPWAYREFQWFDLNAGGGSAGGIEGSPLVFARSAAEIALPHRGYLFEQEEENIRRLDRVLKALHADGALDAGRLQIIRGDHNRTVPWFIREHLSKLPRKWVYGLAYGDGNGRKDAPFGPLADVAARFPQVDLLLNVNATIYKREGGQHPDMPRLLDGLAGIDKRYRLIREPVGIHQWTMLLLTNWPDVPRFEQIGFRRLESPEGREIADRVNFSKRERLEARCS